jgi:hypothetical protein
MDRPETIWAETPNFRRDDTIPGVVSPGSSDPVEQPAVVDDWLPEELEDDGPPIGWEPAPRVMEPEVATKVIKDRGREAQHAFIDLAHWVQDHIEGVPLEVLEHMDKIKTYIFDGAGG